MPRPLTDEERILQYSMHLSFESGMNQTVLSQPSRFSPEFLVMMCMLGESSQDPRITWEFGVPSTSGYCNDLDCEETPATWTAHHDEGWDTYHCDYHKSLKERL